MQDWLGKARLADAARRVQVGRHTRRRKARQARQGQEGRQEKRGQRGRQTSWQAGRPTGRLAGKRGRRGEAKPGS
jgi:hypothetical protein